MSDTQHAHTPIAIVGVSAIFPGSTDKAGFWRDIVRGADLLTDVPPSHWLIDDYYDPDPTATDKTYAKRGGFLSPLDFDPAEAGMPPKLMPSTDTSQLLSLIAARRVLEDAFPGARMRDVPRDRIGIVLGVTGAQELAIAMAARLQHPIWRKAMRDSGMEEGQITDVIDRIRKSFPEWTEASFPGLLGNVVAGRVANRLDLHGPNCVTDAACASALAAVNMSISELQLGRADVVITGGVDTMNDVFMYVCFSKTPALSRTGDCRPFSKDADGTMLGEGLALFALKRLADAERDGDRVYAVIRGLGAASDGKSKSVYAPLPEGQARAVRRAYEEAGYSPATVELLEAHGTGTVAGDAAEFAGVSSVFDASGRADRQWCALGSVKSQIGHTKAAAGAAGMFKAAMALHHRVLPPTIKVTEPNPELHLPESAFYLSTRARPWIRGTEHPRRASVSSFGFGGSNFHVCLEEYVGPAAHPLRLRHTTADLLAFSGASAAEVITAARAAAASLADPATPPADRAGAVRDAFARVARASQASFDAKAAARLLVVADNVADARQKLEQAALRVERAPDRDLETPDGTYYACSAPAQKVGVIFPGQGSQRLYMGADLAMAFPEAQAVWDAAGTALGEIAMPRPVFGDAAVREQEARLTATEQAQPALAAASLAAWRVLSRLGLRADAFAGHSFGEVTALHAAGVLASEDDLLHVARERGRVMGEAAAARPEVPGAMAAVACSIARLLPLLDRFGLDVRIANHNAPEQLVIAGPSSAVEEATKRLAAEGIQVQALNVATAFHSPLVEGATGPFRQALEAVPFGAATGVVYANASAEPYPAGAGPQRDLLAGQIARPVRFVEMIERMVADGVDLFVEVGPDAVLTRLAGRILEGKPQRAVATDRKGRDGVLSLLHALGQLGAAGVPLELGKLWEAYEAPPPAPSTAKRMLVPVQGNNYGKPYPPLPGTPVAPPYKSAVPKVAAPPPPAPVAAPVAAPAPAPVAVRAPAPAPAPMAVRAPAPAPVPVVAPVPVPPPAGPAAPELQHAWLEAIERVQSRAVDAHSAFQRALVDSHQAFLRSTEASLFGLAALAGEAAPGVALPAFAAPRAQVVAAPAPAPAVIAAPPAPVYQPVMAPPPAPVALPAPVSAPAPVAVAAPVAVHTPPPAAARAPARDLTSLLAAIVADKTGYPAEMLKPEMALEADLGIDSIKRVEILSAVRDAVPELPALDPKALGTLQTLGEVAERLRASMPTGAVVPVAAAPAVAKTPAAAAPARDVMALLATIVADKTGYPSEMLRPEMALEADLGIDSIKRVEILSAMRDAVPELPQLDPKALGTLQTLGEVADKLRASMPASAPAVVAPAAGPTAAPAPARDVMALLATIVADKTGYPSEMLRPEMALEADLGIDSIKRVEILSAMRDAVPELPQLDPKALGTLQTLGEVADRLRASLGGGQASGVSQPAKVAPEAVAAPAKAVRLPRLVVDWVARAAPGLGMPGLFACRRIAVVEGSAGIGVELARRLAALGLPAVAVAAVDAEADGVIDLRALAPAGDPDSSVEVMKRAFQLARAVAPRLAAGGGAYVLASPLPEEQPWLAGLAALARTAALEWPAARVRGIAVGGLDRSAAEVAEDLFHELTQGGPDEEVAVGRGPRRVRRLVEAEATGGSGLRLGRGDVVVVSGGGRGVTARCTVALAEAAPGATFVLLGRSALDEEPERCHGVDDASLTRALAAETPSPAALRERVHHVKATREIRRTIDALRRAGATAEYVAVDVADARAVASALDRVRAQHGPITAVVHGAGVIADKPIAEKSDDQVALVLGTKLAGISALLGATRHDPLRALVLFSSIAGRTGNIGQSDYAMANAVLNAVAVAEHARRGDACVVKSIGWGPWDGGMVTPGLAAHFARLGVPLIPLDAGAAALVAECLSAPTSEVDVLLGVPGGTHAPGAPRRPWEAAVVCHPSTHGFLLDHQLRGTVIVPVVMAIEWCARAATGLRPDLAVSAIDDVSVFRGIKLGAFDGGPAVLRISAEQVSNGDGARVRVTITDLADRPHYRCEVALDDHAAGAPLRALAAPGAPFGGAIYDGHALFHGPAFQVLDSVDGVDADAASAGLRGARFVEGWPGGGWETDPAAMDGALQLAILWARERMGGAMLPSHVGHVRRYQAGLARTRLRGVVTSRDVQPTRVLTDVALVDAEGRLFVELHGVETHLRPDDGSR